jgi:penicillin-binding protein 2
MRIYEDLRDVQARLGVVQRVVVTLLLGLIGTFWHLQIHRGLYYQRLANQNRERTVPIAAPRGRLLDREGRVLVENRPAFNVTIAPERGDDLDRTVERLARALEMGEAPIRERLARQRVRFRPVVVKSDATLEDVTAVDARRYELPDVSVDVVPLRSYPLATDAAHTLGRVGEVTERQLQLPEFDGVRPGTLVGQAGLEAQYNSRLMGEEGLRRVIVDSRGVEVGEAERRQAREGPSLTLTLDADLQRAMEDALAGQPGSAVALDPRTGEILAMVSTPAYDPNQFTGGIGQQSWAELLEDEEKPLMNRVIQGQYAPGSVFKLVVAAAALEEGVVTPQTRLFCSGVLPLYDTVFHCNRAGGHGTVNVRQALQHSCNVYFWRVGVQLGIDRIASWATRLGIGAPTGIDLPHEMSGLMPSSEWKQRVAGKPWYAGETMSVAIGQGQVTATPIQLARVAAAMASGRLVTPHLVRAVGGKPVPPPAPRELDLKPETLEAIRAGMRAVVEEHGTGWRAHIPGITIAGKTGSAQVVGRASRPQGEEIPRTLRAHGWFVAYAPVESPSIALAVIVEHSGSGSLGAAPVARRILVRYFGRGQDETLAMASPEGPAPESDDGD